MRYGNESSELINTDVKEWLETSQMNELTVKNTSNNIVPSVILFNVLVRLLICGFVIFTHYLILTCWLNNDYCGFFLHGES